MQKIITLLLLIPFTLSAQEPDKLNSSEIYQEIQELNFLGSALYIAAHPDDENTRLISYLSNALNARTAYLSLTRGDGGQNLIGPELRELLGIIRTQELLAARNIDGGHQLFTRANDFGYSKNPRETLEIWEEEEILQDVIRAIRSFRPDVIINRFNANSAGETHGHHTASAILSERAFKLAADSSVFPQQARELGTWQPQKLFFNTSPWFYESQEAFEAASKKNFLQFDTGIYYPLMGYSNTEIAALSRSQHRSQGFGSSGSRGSTLDYVELIAGTHPKDQDSIFAGINTTWTRIKGGKAIGKILEAVAENYDFQDPAASIPELLRAYKLILELENRHWREIKTRQIKKIIAAAAGLYLEAVAETPLVSPGSAINLQLEAINRSPVEMKLVEVRLPGSKTIAPQTILGENIGWEASTGIRIPENSNFSSPYWLREPGSIGMYSVQDPALIGLPESPPAGSASFLVSFGDIPVSFEREIVYKRTDPVLGEVYRPFEIVPAVSVHALSDVVIFSDTASRKVSVSVTAMRDSVSGRLVPGSYPGWKFSPDSYDLGLLDKGETHTFVFEVQPPLRPGTITFDPIVVSQDRRFDKAVVFLDYPHIPFQTLVLPGNSSLVKLDIRRNGNLIGYIPGAGDVVPEALAQIGYEVEILSPEGISASALERFDAVVMGIRAYNTVGSLRHTQDELLEYVRNGGTLLVQYNTNRGLVTSPAPYPMEISRDRVTDETAEVVFLNPEHPALNHPNKITSEDFENWVQERGLYFPDQWSPEFTAVLEMHDPGESPKKGSLLIAPYGKGHFIYTGLSFFRQFPAGVPGAFRLFSNLLSLGSTSDSKDPKS